MRCIKAKRKYLHGSWQPTTFTHEVYIAHNIRALKFRGSPALQKHFNNEHIPSYGNAFISVFAEAMLH